MRTLRATALVQVRTAFRRSLELVQPDRWEAYSVDRDTLYAADRKAWDALLDLAQFLGINEETLQAEWEIEERDTDTILTNPFRRK